MSTPRTAACVLCGRTASLRSVTAAIQLDCPDCGLYEMTVGAIGALRADAALKAAVRVEVKRQLDAGVERPTINIEVLQALKAR